MDASAYLTYLYHRPQLQPIDKRFHEILDEHISQDRNEDIANDPLTPSAVIEPEDSGGGEQWQTLHKFDPRTVDEKELTPRHYMLFPRRIMGMTIKDKQWGEYRLGSLNVSSALYVNVTSQIRCEPSGTNSLAKGRCTQGLSTSERELEFPQSSLP